jgi:antitoxin (DNA-binding transcriptional repressor) of toxin-antitoxin stability system
LKRYTVAQLRERLASALDEAERGVPVVIERRNVRYVLRVESSRARPRKRTSVIETLDPAIADGQWTWEWKPGRMKLKHRRGQ